MLSLLLLFMHKSFSSFLVGFEGFLNRSLYWFGCFSD